VSITSTPARERLTVSALAKRVGVGPDTIRYYEKAGLLPAPERTASDYRAYDHWAVDRLRFIQGGQRLGLRLAEIRTLLEVRDTGQCPCEPAGQLLRKHISEIDAEMRRLRRLRTELVSMTAQLPSVDCPDPAPGTWRPQRAERDEFAEGGETVMDAPSWICPCCEDSRCDGSCCGGGCR
jgi:DNA-binding transcriptional MerR regulator